MNIKRFLIALVLPLMAACLPEVKPVEYVNINNYLGTWYQISAYETFFNQGLVGVTAEYSLNEDGTVNVVNNGYKGSFDGELDTITGTATVVDTVSFARLNVLFPGAPDLFPQGNYWIVSLDDVNYQYAAVTDPLGSTLFVLSRTPTLDDETYQLILTMLKAMRLDVNRLKLTPQQT
jgi:apolipoprotein D and lipocalin family protein